MFQLMRNSPTCTYIDQNPRKWKLCYMDPRCVCMGKKNMVEIPHCTTFLKWLWVEQCLIPKKWDHQRTHKIFLILSRLCTPCPKKRGLRIWSTSTSVLFNSTQQIGRCFVLCMVKKNPVHSGKLDVNFLPNCLLIIWQKVWPHYKVIFFEVERQTNPNNNCWKKIWTHPILPISTKIYGKIFKLFRF